MRFPSTSTRGCSPSYRRYRPSGAAVACENDVKAESLSASPSFDRSSGSNADRSPLRSGCEGAIFTSKNSKTSSCPEHDNLVRRRCSSHTGRQTGTPSAAQALTRPAYPKVLVHVECSRCAIALIAFALTRAGRVGGLMWGQSSTGWLIRTLCVVSSWTIRGTLDNRRISVA
jgi:hypothetical protein